MTRSGDLAWDPELALARVDGDSELLRELIELFLGDFPQQLQQLQAAVAQAEASAIEAHAHAMKGAAANFAAQNVVELALELEMIGRANRLTGAGPKLAALCDALAVLNRQMLEFLT